MFASGKKWLPIVVTFTIVCVVTGCKSNGEAYGPATDAPVTSEELSYRNVPLLDDGSAPATSYGDDAPGESERFTRSFENAPPMIPHDIADQLPIAIDDNACLECHLPDVAEDEGATAVPASHFYDIRQGKQLTELAGANFNCTLCHAPQVEAPALVENLFAADFRDQQSEKSSNLLDILNEGVE